MKRLLLALALTCPFVLDSCGHATVGTQPNSPQTTVAQLNKTVADANLAGVKTVIGLRDSGKITQAVTDNIENYLALVATTSKSIGVILQKPEAWTAQKAEILTLLATVTAPTIATTIDPGAQAVVTQIVTLLNQIKTQVVP